MRNMKWNRQNLHDSCLMFRGTEQWSKVEGIALSAWLSTLPGDPPSHAFTLSQPLWLLVVTPTFHSETGTFTYAYSWTNTAGTFSNPPPLFFTRDVSVHGLSYWLLWRLSLSTEEKLLLSGLSGLTRVSSFLVMSHKDDLQSAFSPSPIFT